jgi:hypothetical protein
MNEERNEGKQRKDETNLKRKCKKMDERREQENDQRTKKER